MSFRSASLFRQSLPNEGFDELQVGLAADDYWGTTLGKTDTFGSGNCYIAFLGTPSTTE